MKYSLAVVVFLMASLTLAADTNAPPMGTLAYMDWRNGFRDLKFGEVLSNRADMVRLKDSDWDEYERKPENLSIGTATAKAIYYSTTRGKLHEISIIIAHEDLEQVRDVFVAAYGEPGPAIKGTATPEERWKGKIVQMFTRDTPGDAFVTIYNSELSQQFYEEVEAKKKADAAKAAKGL